MPPSRPGFASGAFFQVTPQRGLNRDSSAGVKSWSRTRARAQPAEALTVLPLSSRAPVSLTARRPMPDATAIIRRCVTRCASHRDGRGPWQAERACFVALGSSPTDRATAAAARAFGVWLGSVDISAPGTTNAADCAPSNTRPATPHDVAGVRLYST